jgi:hypothetical protein
LTGQHFIASRVCRRPRRLRPRVRRISLGCTVDWLAADTDLLAEIARLLWDNETRD